MRFLVVSGRSGSGKTAALHLLEDEGFICIDNLPINLLSQLIEQICQTTSLHANYAIGIDARNIYNDLSKLPDMLKNSSLTEEQYEILFLDCSRERLLTRFSETRRRHPMSDDTTGLNEAIAKEKPILEPLAQAANVTIDTTNLNLHELRGAVKRLLVGNSGQGTAIMFSSFGFKFGMPASADFVFDVRALPNPYWSPELRSKSGQNDEVIAFLDAQPMVQEMFNDILAFVHKWAPQFEKNNRSYLTIAIGCTGGWHRSVYLCNKLAAALKSDYPNVLTHHRQIENKSSL